jgi:hypothetical protein
MCTYRETQPTLPELKFNDDDQVLAAKSDQQRLVILSEQLQTNIQIMAGNAVLSVGARGDVYDLFHCSRQPRFLGPIGLRDLVKEHLLIRQRNTTAVIMFFPEKVPS